MVRMKWRWHVGEAEKAEVDEIKLEVDFKGRRLYRNERLEQEGYVRQFLQSA